MRSLLRPHFLYLAPLVLLAHVAEEAPGLVVWMNSRLELDYTIEYFVGLNVFGLFVTAVAAVSYVRSRNQVLALGLIGWLSFLMMANGSLHLAATLIFREYVPGTVTAGILYLPYFFAAAITICRNSNVRARTAILAATIGAVPMVLQGASLLSTGRRVLW